MIILKQDLILNLKDKKLDLRQKGIHFLLYINNKSNVSLLTTKIQHNQSIYEKLVAILLISYFNKFGIITLQTLIIESCHSNPVGHSMFQVP